MFPHAIRLARVAGIEIRIDPSWLIIAFLFGWSFYAQFGSVDPSLQSGALLFLAATSVVVFFLSVLLHELSHSLVARRLGIPVEGITLFLFGGVSTTKMEAKRPRDEFLMAVMGPVTSLVLAGLMWLLVNSTGNLLAPSVAYAVGYLGWLNLALGVFNLLPGFPLDGGRVLRSILWMRSGDMTSATRGAARGGKVIAVILMAIGVFLVFGGDLGGLWLAAIGWFLAQAASAADNSVVLGLALKGVRARDLMSLDLVSIPSDATLQEAVDDYFLRHDHSAFPVSYEDRTGLLTLRAVKQIPRDQWERRQVWTAATRLEDTCTVEPDTSMDHVMERLREQDHDRVLVVDEGHVLGIITPRDVSRWVQRSKELGRRV